MNDTRSHEHPAPTIAPAFSNEQVVYMKTCDTIKDLRQIRNRVAGIVVVGWTLAFTAASQLTTMQGTIYACAIIFGCAMMYVDGYWLGRIRRVVEEWANVEYVWTGRPGSVALEDVRRGFLGVTLMQWMICMGLIVWIVALLHFYKVLGSDALDIPRYLFRLLSTFLPFVF